MCKCCVIYVYIWKMGIRMCGLKKTKCKWLCALNDDGQWVTVSTFLFYFTQFHNWLKKTQFWLHVEVYKGKQTK